MKCPICQFDNPADTVFCAKCGTEIDERVSESEESGPSAKNSNLRIGAKGTDPKISVTRTLETTPKGLGKGELFAGRFELIEELGSGGMGKVYRAFDKKIGEEVAIKLLHPEIALDERTIDRFRNEIKLARRITHKNVCRLHELHEEGKTLFITMEYVSGQDLKGLILERRALTTGQAISIAKQVAEGMAEAHDLGVVHRDLKPQNIMVDKEGLAKIMDFGIARSLRTLGMTAEGMIIGTPEYMAPEQVEGRDADQRTDIYALGAILFEMVTGRPPFEGDSPLSVAYKHKNETPIPPRELNSQIPEPFNQLILRCLEKDKENRYQSSDELLGDLIRIEEGLPISERIVLKARPTIRISRERAKGLKRFRVPAIIALALVIVAAVIFSAFFYKPSPPPAPKISNSVAIISFENLTGDNNLDIWSSRGIPEGLISNLGNSGYFRVIPWERTLDILKQMGKKNIETIDSDLGFELCRRAGIESLVTGTLTKAGDMFALNVRVLDANTMELRKSAASRGKGEESILITQVDELSRAIAEALGTSKEKVEQTQFQVAGILTPKSEAWRLFIIGKERAENVDPERAAEYLEKAIKIDPQFALAHLQLSIAYGVSQKRAAQLEALKKAMELSGRAPEKDRLKIEASYARWIEGNLEKSIVIYEEIVKKYPDDKQSYYDLGAALNAQGRSADAVAAFQESLRLDPEYGSALNSLGYIYARLGEFEKAVDAFRNYISLTPREANPWDSLGEVYAKTGKIEDAISSYREALKIQPDFESSNLAMSFLHAFREDYQAALDSVGRYMSLDLSPERRADAFLWKGYWLYWLGRFSESLGAFQQAEEASRTADWRFKPALFLQRSQLYFDRREFESARQSAQKFVQYRVELAPNSRVAIVKIGDFLEGLCDAKEGRLDSAKAKLEGMKSALTDVSRGQKEDLTENILLLQAEIHLAEGSVEEALVSLEKIVPSPGMRQFQPYNFYFLSNNWAQLKEQRARSYKIKGDLDRAISEYEKMISPDPTKSNALIHPRYYYSLGKLYEQKGMKDKARRHYRRFLELWKDADPGIAEVDDAKAHLAALK
jgi:serine/threonine protein kinase/tetratricopeptide (TPR) repeat protein